MLEKYTKGWVTDALVGIVVAVLYGWLCYYVIETWVKPRMSGAKEVTPCAAVRNDIAFRDPCGCAPAFRQLADDAIEGGYWLWNSERVHVQQFQGFGHI